MAPPDQPRPLPKKPPSIWVVSPSLALLDLAATIGGVAVAGSFSLLFLLATLGASSLAFVVPGSLTLVAIAVTVVLVQRVRRSLRDRREHLRADSRRCTHCGYDINTDDDAGICPECGNKFDHTPDTWTRLKRDVELHRQRGPNHPSDRP